MTYLDTHLHVLPGLDDGPVDLDDCLAMLRDLRGFGFEEVVPVFHLETGQEDRRDRAAAVLEILSRAATGEGYPRIRGCAAEHRIDPYFWQCFHNGSLVCYPDGRHVLVEGHLGTAGLPPKMDELIFKLRLKGKRPVLAHPERFDQIQRNPDLVASWKDMGLRMQLDLLSLTGEYGRLEERTARRLLDAGHYDVAATDVHSRRGVGKIPQALEILRDTVGAAASETLLATHPRVLVGDLDEEILEP